MAGRAGAGGRPIDLDQCTGTLLTYICGFESARCLRLLPKRSFSPLIRRISATDRRFVRDGEVPFTSVDRDHKALFDMQ